MGLFLFSHYGYYICATGIKFKNKTYPTRKGAENAMRKFCQKNNIEVECTECDKHERKYSNHKGIRFYINRVIA